MPPTMNSTRLLILCIITLAAVGGCTTVKLSEEEVANQRFLNPSPDESEQANETFRVFITSDKYIVVQMKFKGSIQRAEDAGGDSYICDEVKKYDKINETREGLWKIWLYPDKGNLQKIRPQKSIYLIEIDKLINEDIQRWGFTFPQKSINPTQFFIRYRILLKKRQADVEILKELQQKMKDNNQ